MKCLLGGLCVYCSLILGLSFPLMKSSSDNTHHGMSPPHPQHNIPGFPDRCDGLGFDAITLDEKGDIFYFRDEFLWKGFNGTAEFINNTWPQLPTHIDAAIRIHHKHAPEYHDRMFFFKGTQVYQYYGTTFEGKFLIHDKFPGIPNNLEAAMECPVGVCAQDSVLFFKGDMVSQLNLNTTTVKARSWFGLGHCGAALRWLERDYCFDGTNFTRFHPSTGHIPKGYPKDARDYFMQCEGRGHGTWNNTAAKSIHNRCSNESFEEFNEDEIGRMYAFRNNWYFRLDTNRDGWHPWPIHSSWPSLHGNIDGVFSWDKKMYFIQL
ncbi:hemopexin [Scyliorhinus canicula]|uniref:hemopexin n=1 Tax=Scyliorhinus canicula TaxID=7830 RepID=UPI0018F6BCAD|nr:hemopexin [Scyliorhinus canicula]